MRGKFSNWHISICEIDKYSEMLILSGFLEYETWQLFSQLSIIIHYYHIMNFRKQKRKSRRQLLSHFGHKCKFILSCKVYFWCLSHFLTSLFHRFLNIWMRISIYTSILPAIHSTGFHSEVYLSHVSHGFKALLSLFSALFWWTTLCDKSLWLFFSSLLISFLFFFFSLFSFQA